MCEASLLFLNRVLQLLREYHGQTRIHLNPEFHRDLRWFERFLPLYNGITLYDHQKTGHQVHLDACLQGLGGVWQNMVYHLPVPLGFNSLSIVHLQMLNILVAVKIFCTHWKEMNILIHSDNFAIVNVLKSGKAQYPYLAACARNIWLWAATHDLLILMFQARATELLISCLGGQTVLQMWLNLMYWSQAQYGFRWA